MSHLRLGWITMLSMLALSPAWASQCRIERFPAIHVTMKGLRPMVSAKINGARARFFVDTGAFWSMLSPAAQSEYNLPEQPAPVGFYLSGVNGYTDVDIATVDTFTFLNVPFHHMQFLVGGNDFQSGAVGLLGENLLRATDVEYDFANGVMRFVKTRHCGDQLLAYWAGHQPIGMVKLNYTTTLRPSLIGHARVNGKRIRVLFDTGAGRSMLTLDAARRLGITPSSPGVRLIGKFPGGIARKWIKFWIAPVARFEIGGEKIEHTHLLIGASRQLGGSADMLLGSDFFLSHHVYVANGQHRLYFTYNGGPIFALGQRYLIRRPGAAPVLAGPGAGTPAAPAAARAAASRDETASSGLADADELARRGMAYASERQYALALADLDRACRLDPKNPEYFLRRGEVYRANKQAAKALADFNTTIKLKPKLFQAHLARAALLLAWKHAPTDAGIQARADINIVALLAPDQSELHLPLARLYARIGQYPAAIRQIDQWIYYHGDDALLPVAWNTRCWIRAEADIDLSAALKDCDHAHEQLPHSGAVFDSRGLVYLRLGRFDRSIKDYDAALKINPRIATSLYGRGLDELRQGKKAQGQSDLAAAKHINPRVVERFSRMKLAP